MSLLLYSRSRRRMRATMAAVAVLAAAAATTGAMAGSAQAAATGSHWTENLSQVRSSDFNVAWTGEALTVKDSRVHATSAQDTRGYGQDVLPAHSLASPANQVVVTLTASRPAGSEAQVDVRGLGLNGKWTQWTSARATGATRLPESVTKVQARITLRNGAQGAVPGISKLTLDAADVAGAVPQLAPASESYQVYATREGLVGGTTANGHVIQPNDHFVALPSGTALSPNGSGDYSVQVCGPSTCETAPVWDVGPWNTHDDYWDASRAEFTDLPQGEPEAQAAYQNGYNGGHDEFGRSVSNPAGIDLADGTFYNIGLNDNGWVTVTYLWTGGGGGSGPSVTGIGQCATSSNADCSGAAAGDGSDCYSGHFCIYTGPNYTGTVFSFYHCQYNGGDWALQNWDAAGSYINDNSGGTDADTKDQNHNVITASAPGDRNTNYDFNPVYYIQAC
ncbi:peptidase inhibitor family I36 protein [Catenulispora sp. NF23]|uniref:Peptidase inhibitor family I36 protein n=1 Tax=Catenulispora pinistramenti TaxID=2705254 RepID=A0ABS5KIQ0_9ACTN|nr:peptidase inhibitor family I36 protein [Catenulispora pinistramenti]MBS2532613.1 peptidase inhibitor family I36 protein [Catenulispora pinistramenti]MBS2546279.1 peptidase inhibitor family I36 protein [Catenulispora pinistramenti]